MNKNIVLTGLLGALALSLVGCGGSSGAVLGLNTNPRIRTVNMISAPTTTSILIDSQAIDANATFGFCSDYNIFPSGNHTIQFNSQATSANLVNISPHFQLNGFYSVIAYNTSPTTYGSLVVNDVPGAVDQDIHVKAISVLTSPATVDVYVTQTGTAITGQPPTISNLTAGNNPPANYVNLGANPASYTVTVTQHGNQTVLATSTSTQINAGQYVNFVLANDASGTPQVTGLPAATY